MENRFFKWGVSVFDTSLPQYGGFNHWIGKYIFRYKIHHLTIELRKDFKFSYLKTYYDGYHNILRVGFLSVYYQT